MGNKWLGLILLLASFCPAQNFYANLEQVPLWETCVKPACNPGGPGIPTSTTNKLVGSRREFGVAGPAYTNALFVMKTGPTTANTLIGQFDLYILSMNAQAYEVDMFIFAAPTEWMFGTQCEPGQDWQVWGNKWIHTGIPCVLKIGKNRIQWFVHRDGLDMHYDELVVNDVVTSVNMVEPASALPGGWNTTSGIQFQMDINGTGTPVNVYVKNVSFIQIP